MICNCFTCPLGIESYEQQLKIYEHLNEPPDYEEIVYSIWCDKIGSKCGWHGYCEDAFTLERQLTPIHNNRRCERSVQNDLHAKRIEKLYIFCRRRWMSPYYQFEGRIVESNYSWRRKRFYKRQSNKYIRKYDGDISNGNEYRKVYNYTRMID